MKIKHLLVSANQGQLYLVVGYTDSTDILPSEWQLPVIPNELEDLNIEKVIKSHLLDDYGLTLDKVIEVPANSDLAFVSVKEVSLAEPTMLIYEQDPDDYIQHRKFVTKQEFRKLIKSNGLLASDDYPDDGVSGIIL